MNPSYRRKYPKFGYFSLNKLYYYNILNYFYCSETLILRLLVSLLECSSSSICITLQTQYCVQIQWSQWETLLTLLYMCTQKKVILSILTLFHIQIVFDQLQEHPLHLIYLLGFVLGECFSEIIILKGLVIPNLRCQYLQNILFIYY